MKKIFLLLILLTKLTTGVSYSQTTFIPTGAATIYDLQSMATPIQIIQDKNNTNNIHAVYTVSPYNDSTDFPHRTVKYYFSSDKGQTWNLAADFLQVSKSGFPSLSIMSNGNAIISLLGGTPKKTYTFVDAFPGLGSFAELGSAPCFGSWPQIVSSESISQTRKFHIINSVGFTSGLSILNPSYSPCVEMQGMSMYSFSIAKGADGRIGIAYVVDAAQLTGNSGDVMLIESTDNGQSFSNPLKIFDATIHEDNTFFGAFKGISLVYNNNTPNVVFEVCKQNLSGNFYPKEPAGIRHWSPLLNGSNPNKSKFIARNDSTNFLSSIPFYNAYANDFLTSICRPSIGTFSDSNYMAVVFISSTQNTRVYKYDTISYNAVYLTYTYNKGTSWTRPKKITPDELRDWTYPSISAYNFSSTLPYKANIIATRDSIPGTYVNNSSFGKSLAQQFYLRSDVGMIVEPGSATITTGNIKYNDNNQLVTNGRVKALRFDESSGQVIVTTIAPIDANGNYTLSFDKPYYTHYIVAYPNSENKSDFIPTFYPETINWQNALTINSSVNNSNINIGVFRKHDVDGVFELSGVVNGVHNSGNSPLANAYLYIKSGDNYLKYVESDSNGRYSFTNLPAGNFEIIATELGYSTISQKINLQNSMDSVNFSINQILANVISISNIIPEKYALYQNYPNPFNPVTNIKFDIPKASYVKINVYNVLGKEVSLLMSENKPAGRYSIDFDASSLTSGVYFYKIETGDFAETKRMVILK